MRFKTVEELKQYLCDRGFEESIVFEDPDYCDAAIGVTTDGRVVYDYGLMAESLMAEDGMTYEDALEIIDYNTVRALPYIGDNAPIVMYGIEE